MRLLENLGTGQRLRVTPFSLTATTEPKEIAVVSVKFARSVLSQPGSQRSSAAAHMNRDALACSRTNRKLPAMPMLRSCLQYRIRLSRDAYSRQILPVSSVEAL